jgi:hypothetical protein
MRIKIKINNNQYSCKENIIKEDLLKDALILIVKSKLKALIICINLIEINNRTI